MNRLAVRPMASAISDKLRDAGYWVYGIEKGSASGSERNWRREKSSTVPGAVFAATATAVLWLCLNGVPEGLIRSAISMV